MRKLRDLLSRGYFPRELPPVFGTSSMRRVATMINAAPASFWSTSRTSEPCQHNVPRSGTLRRPLAIPNPVGYANLCREIDRSWREISRHIAKPSFQRVPHISIPLVLAQYFPRLRIKPILSRFGHWRGPQERRFSPLISPASMVPFTPTVFLGRCIRNSWRSNEGVTMRYLAIDWIDAFAICKMDKLWAYLAHGKTR